MQQRGQCAAAHVLEDERLTPIDELCELLASEEPLFKPNVGVVCIDFLMRNGFVSPDDPSYLQLLGALRSAECS